MGKLERWVNELQIEIDKLKRIVIDGGGFDPTLYTYNTPFINLAGEDHTIAYYNPLPDQTDPDEGLKHLTYTVTVDSIVMVDLDASISPETSTVTIFDNVNTKTLFSANDGQRHLFTVCIKAGQTIRVSHTDISVLRLGHIVFYICPLQVAQLQPRTTILDRAITAVKKVTKKRTTKKKEE